MLQLILILFISFSGLSLGSHNLEEISNSSQWHRLMHYQLSFPFRTIKSRVDGKDFFFSPEGKTNPLSELRASISAFSQAIKVGKLKQHPQCAFPARFRFIRNSTGLAFPEVKCPQFEEFINRLNPHSVTLVFSSAYPNNPGSMFGHTFLRVNKKPKANEKKLDILDFGISFAAKVADDENPFSFILFGLTGGYQGQFSSVPYYVKVNEYSNAESRDVWEYDLSLSPEESRNLVAHVWELETNSHFDYYFFDENCAYELMTLLEVAKPDWDLSYFPVYVIPSETIKKIMAVPGAVTHVRFRPSLRRKMLQKVELLTREQKEQLQTVLSKKTDPKRIEDPFVLDAAIANLFYEKQEKEGFLEESDKNLQASLLLQRSKLGKNSEQDDSKMFQSVETRPDLGHYSYRASISPGYFSLTPQKTEGLFQEFGIKTAYHDLLNKDLGYLRFSQIDFPNIYFRFYPNNQKLQLEKFELLHITSLFPLGFIEKRPSWKLQVGYVSARDLLSENTGVFRLESGLGATVELWNEKNIIYFLVLGHLETGSPLARGYRVGPRFQLATLLNPSENYKTRLSGTVSWDLFQNDRPDHYFHWDWEHALSLSQSWEVRMTLGVWQAAYQEAKISANYYF